jgi:hypothetical protein
MQHWPLHGSWEWMTHNGANLAHCGSAIAAILVAGCALLPMRGWASGNQPGADICATVTLTAATTTTSMTMPPQGPGGHGAMT